MAKRVLSEEELIKDRLAYVGTLAGGLAHEVRSPLNSIHINIELLERSSRHFGEEDKKVFLKRVSRVKEEVSNLQNTLTEFLQFAKPPGLKRLGTNIKDFIYDVVEFISPELLQEKIRVKIKCGEHPYPALIDRRQIEQVLQNLIFNARDSMPEGGTIEISTHEGDSHIRMDIRDDGVGIDPEVMPKIFDAFFTTKEKGTGLGLGITRRIIQEHGGSVRVKSPIKNGRGCLFEILLPKEKLLPYSDVQENTTP